MRALIKNHDGILSIQPRTRRLTRGEAHKLSAQLSRAASSSPRMMLDLSQVDYIDSVGFKVLLTTLQTARSFGGDLKLVAPRPPVQTLLELTRLYRVFDLHAEPRLAVAAFQQTRARARARQQAAL